jgi:hypothetical protein
MYLGRQTDVASGEAPRPYELPTQDLVTHGVVVGMTGSGKTGLCLVMVEEALRARVPVLLIDIKGDLANLLLSFPELSPAEFAPWVDTEAAARGGKTPEQVATELSRAWQAGLAASGLGKADVADLASTMAPRLVTPGASFGEPLNVLSALDRRSPLWDEDEEAAHDALAASVSLALRLAGLDGDPRSREHVVLSTFAERRLRENQTAALPELLKDVLAPPLASIGALAFEQFLPPKDQKNLAQALNTLLASPKLSTWLRGSALDVAAWLTPLPDKTPAVVVSVAHLDDEERALVLGVLLEEVIAYVRGLSGTSELRSMILFDEIYGFLPPHPHNPPTKKPLLGLLKQARAFGVGVVLATQNPMDVDYKALSNAGAWFVGRLQTDADRERVVEGLAGAGGASQSLEPQALEELIKSLPKRTFLVRDVHRTPPVALVETRFCMSYLRGPLTRREIGKLAKALAPPPNRGDTPLGGGSRGAGPREAQRADRGLASSSAPAAPDGFRVLHGFASGAVTYAPYVAGSILLRVRDTKLGLAFERSVMAVAPILADGRADLTRLQIVDPQHLGAQPAAGASYRPIPAALASKKATQALERSLREHVAANVPMEVDVNRELGLARGRDESPEAFVQRCRAASRAALADEQRDLELKLAPRLAKLEERLAVAQRAFSAKGQALGQAPSEVGTVLMGVFAPRGVASSARKARQKAESGFARAEDATAKAQAAFAEAHAERNAAHAELTAQAERRVHAITTERWLPKRGDAEVSFMAIAWSGIARSS